MSKAAIGRREQNKQEKRARIVAAARALFRHKGFDATTTQEIADAAGVASGTVFTYAPTKDDLLILVFQDEMMGVVSTAYARASEQDELLDRAIAYFETLVAYHERDVQLARLLLRQLGYVSSGDQRELVSELMTSLLGNLAKLIEAAKKRDGVAVSAPAFSAARSLFAIYYYHLGGMMNGYIDRAQFDRALRTDLQTVFRGLIDT
jgi:AcrR family transcriptional regulator